MADVIGRMVERLLKEAPPERTKELLTAAYLLTGLGIQPDVAKQLFQGARAMQESTTYMAILEEGMEKGMEKGKEEGIRETIMQLGEKRFGVPAESINTKLQAIKDIQQLRRLTVRLLDVSTWDELFAE